MKQSTRRKIYYTSIIISLVVILACAVVINRTLVNTPEFDIESISDEAGEPVAAYMAYIDKNGDVVVGISDEEDEDTPAIIDFVRNIQLESEVVDETTSKGKVADAWIALYDDRNRVASRMNFYDGGAVVWYDGKKYNIDPQNMQTIIEYCDAKAEQEEPAPEPDMGDEQTPAADLKGTEE